MQGDEPDRHAADLEEGDRDQRHEERRVERGVRGEEHAERHHHDAEADPATLDQRLDEAAAAYRRLADAAPSDVRGDVRTMTDLVDAVLDAVRANDGDPDATAADLRAAMKRHEGAQAASVAVAAFARTHCDVELNPTVPPDETSRPAGTGSTTASTGGP